MQGDAVHSSPDFSRPGRGGADGVRPGRWGRLGEALAEKAAPAPEPSCGRRRCLNCPVALSLFTES